MRKFFSRAFVIAGMLALVACGGGDGGSAFQDPGTDPGTNPPPSQSAGSIALTSSAASIPADGSGSAEISALVRDTNNNAMSGVTVTFSATAGSIVVTQATTDSTGLARATLTAAGASAGTAITVTVAGGGINQTMTVNVANTQQTVTVTTSAPQIPSDGTAPATITALVRGASNQLLEGVTVNFQATSGGLAVTQAVTDQNGAAIATLSAAGDKTNRRITVTASAGSSTSTVPVDVVGTRLTVTGAASTVQGASAQYDVALVDSANNGISGQTVNISSALGNALSPAGSVTTDSTGRAAFTLTATNAGAEVLSATSMGLTAQQAVAISNQNFAFTAPAANTTVPLSTTQAITLTWSAGGVAQVGQVVTFSTTRGLFTGGVVTTQATTNASGQATVNISSTTSGPAVITASAAGVTSQLTLSFIATTVSSIALQVNPATIPTEGQATITAVVRDPTDNLVQGQTVNFQLTDITGGSLSLASAVTDSQGVARTVYTASTTPSATNGVTVTAGVQGTSVSTSTSFTVGGQAVLLSLGTGTVLGENGAKTQFILPYTVTALDAAGNAVNGVTVTLSVRSLEYAKGGWIKGAAAWFQTGTPFPSPGTASPITVCPNEDLDEDGILDPGEDTSGDGNSNGQLEPGGVAATSVGTLVTADGGSGTFNVVYPEDHAAWVRVALTARATVQGTESSTTASFWLPILASYVNNLSSDPPGRISPFGTATTCTDPD